MRLQLLGNYSLEDFQSAINEIIEDFKSNDVDSFRNVNIYLRPCANYREIELTDEGELIEHMIYDFRQKRQISISSSELSVIRAHKVERKKPEED